MILKSFFSFYLLDVRLKPEMSADIQNIATNMESLFEEVEMTSDKGIIKSLTNLMTLSHHDVENSKIFIENNFERPFYHVQWLWEKLPSFVKFHFESHKQLKNFMRKYSSFYEVHGIYARTKNETSLCEKTISLEILRIFRKKPNANHIEITKNLPSACRTRVRTAKELSKFLNLQEYFHEENSKQEFEMPKLSDKTIPDQKPVQPQQEQKQQQQNLEQHKEENPDTNPEANLEMDSTTSWVSQEIQKLKLQLNELQKELNVDSLKECASKSKKISEKIGFLYNFQCISLEEIDDETFNTIADHDLVIET